MCAIPSATRRRSHTDHCCAHKQDRLTPRNIVLESVAPIGMRCVFRDFSAPLGMDGHRAAGQDTTGSVQIVDCLDRSGCLVPASWQLQMYKNTSSGNSAAASWSSYNFFRNSLPLTGGERRPFFGRRERVLFQRAFSRARFTNE